MRIYMFTSLMLTFLAFYIPLNGQDPMRFAKEVESITSNPLPFDDKVIVFTGSSSIRMWKDLADTYPGFNIVNHGFGGSQMSDLLYYLDDLVLSASPCQVFIYEGDNDISAGKTTGQIIADAKAVCQKIWAAHSDTEIVLISAKPSVARWRLKDQYEALNKAYRKLAEDHDQLDFVDVWTPALDENGMVFKDIFLKDNLHMNDKGYAIWAKTIGSYLRQCP